VEKYCRAGQTTDDKMAHAQCMIGNESYKHTLRIRITYWFSAAKMVTLPDLNVTL